MKETVPLEHQLKVVAVSKYRTVEQIQKLYEEGVRDFGESRVEELRLKASTLPKDIRWHFIGHLQSNKIKQLLPIVSLIQSVDTVSLLEKINTFAHTFDQKVPVLLQIHIAEEKHKYGFAAEELKTYFSQNTYLQLQNIIIQGVMGMATFTSDKKIIRKEFAALRNIFEDLRQTFFSDNSQFTECSMGMSNDYEIAVSEGSTMLRIGSALFED